MSYNRLDGNLTLTLQICMSYKTFKIWAILYFNYTDTRKNDHVTSKSCFLKSKVLENILRERQTCQGLGDEVCEPSLKDLPFEDSTGDLWLRSDIWGVISLKMYTREEPLTALYVRSRILKSIIIGAMLAFLCACWELSCSVLTFSCSWLMSEYMHY